MGRRGALVCAVVGVMTGAVPARAQQAPATATPSPSQTDTGAAPPALDDVDPTAPLAALPDIGVDWPDLSAAPAAPGPPHADPQARA